MKLESKLLYSHDLKKLRDKVSAYLARKGKVLVLFDNLDKSWSTSGVDDIDAITLRCLIDASRKIERDMQRRELSFSCVIFIRNDVYEYLMARSSDYGKEMRATLDWSDPDLLREVIRLRLVSNLEESKHLLAFTSVWSAISVPHVFGEESSSFVIDRSLMRPRNALKLFNHARAFAVNLGKNIIDQDDFYRGLKAYSQDLLIELDREISDVFPEAKDLLYYFIGCTSVFNLEKLDEIMREGKVAADRIEIVRDFLLFHGIIGLRISGLDQYIYDFGYDLKQLKVRLGRLGSDAQFVLNPAFESALDIRDSSPPLD